MKWLLGALGLALLALPLLPGLLNRAAEAELRSHPRSERARKVMLIEFPSGKRIPVNYLREGDRVYAGADGPWWRALRGEGLPVELTILGETLHGHARAIENDPEYKRDVFSRLRPTVPKWLPAWFDGVLVEIRLESQPTLGPSPNPF